MTANVANLFFQEQTYTGIAENADTHEILGLYILILIMLEDVGTSVMPAMLSVKISVDCI